MRKPWNKLLVIAVVIGLCASFADARALGRQPDRFLPGSDGRLISATDPTTGTVWAAWSYRNGAEFDMAVSSIDPDRGFWSEPQLIGLDDGRHQVQPALAADRNGNLYLAFAERDSGRVLLSILPGGSAEWSTPKPLVGPSLRGSSPAVRIIGDRLVIALRTQKGLEILDLPLVSEQIFGNTTDGPDPVGTGSPITRQGNRDEDQQQDDFDEERSGVAMGPSTSSGSNNDDD